MNRRRQRIGLICNELYRRRGRNRHNIRLHRRSANDGRRPRFEREEPSPPVKPDLEIVDVNLEQESNSKNHYTSEYDLTDDVLIVRRGQPFDITIELNRECDPKKDDLKFVFTGGLDPKISRGTLVSLALSDEDKDKEWGALPIENEGKILKVRINTPPTCYVGKWKFVIETFQKSNKEKITFEFECEEHIYILFNPWCKDDTVYVPDQSLLDEYIMNETGKIYTGNKKNIRPKQWVFGQFEENVIECAIELLDTYIESWTVRGDPVKVCRKLSQIVNDGVLVGNWSGDYKGGKSPLHWTGSVAIFKEYFEKKRPVCFGQCWVFSGLMTTLCRTLGIPARSVTNFASAHDCDGSITIDAYYNQEWEPVEELMTDSVWNFHVWNDVWMARPDLPFGYGGWQAVDATPQELSDGKYQCGPAPLEAIRRGEVYLSYDCPFVFAEVNADRVYWAEDEDGESRQIHIDPKSIGKRISTKIPNGKPRNNEWVSFCFDREREDITNLYKYKEGSEEERAAVIKANQTSSKQGIYHQKEQQDVEFELSDLTKIQYGSDIEATLTIQNKSDKTRTVDGCMCITSVYYTGVPAEKVTSLPIRSEQIPPKSSKEVRLVVTFDEYVDCLVDQCHMMLSCMCKVRETNNTYVDKDAFLLFKPELKIKAPEKGRVGVEMKVDISFTNPLKCDLSGCKLTVDGPGLQKPTEIGQSIVKGEHTFMTSIQIIPKKSGKRTLVVKFNSKQMEEVENACEITVDK